MLIFGMGFICALLLVIYIRQGRKGGRAQGRRRDEIAGSGICLVCQGTIHRSDATGWVWHHTVPSIAYAESEDHAAVPA